jgi:hypothetical protein
MSEDPNVKKFVVTGAAAMGLPSSTSQEGGKGKTRKNRKQEGGTSPGTLVQLNTTRSPDSTMANVKPIETSGLKSTLAPVLQGGVSAQSKDVKVILAPKKKKTAKVILATPKKKVLQSIAKAVATAGTKTRKIAKKIRMSISSLSNRMTRAHKIRKESREMPIEKIKEALKQANLIKETTKAPDDILRQMYADYLLLKNRAL